MRPDSRGGAGAAGFTDRSVFTVDRYFDWSSLLGASQSMSLFGDRQLVELRIPTGKPGKEGGEALKTLAAADNPDVLTLITLPRLDAATQKRHGSPRITGPGVALKIDPVERAQLPMWIGQRLGAAGPARRAGRRRTARAAVHRRTRRGQSARRASGNPEARAAVSRRAC